MKELVKNRVVKNGFSANSRKIAEQSFDERKVLAKQIALFDSLTK